MKTFEKFIKSVTYAAFAAAVFLPVSLAHAEMLGAKSAAIPVKLTQASAENDKMDLVYDIYAGGFKALHATLDLDLDPEAYDMALKANTQGFIGNLFPWSATYETAGHAQDGKPVPTQHTAHSVWKKKAKITEMTYGPQGDLLKMTTQENNKTEVKRDIEKNLTENSVDILTGTLMMMQHTKNTDKCKGSFPVFDGKRRFNITLQDAGREVIENTGHSIFSGEALKCTLRVEPVAGFKPKDARRGWMAVQNHTEERKKPPTIWFARLEENGPVVPVRMEINSDYGAVVAHLSSK